MIACQNAKLLPHRSAFCQVSMRKQYRKKTGCSFDLNLYQLRRVPFGFCYATATFQRRMAQALSKVEKEVRKPHDVLCRRSGESDTFADHINRVDYDFDSMKTEILKHKHRSAKSSWTLKSIWAGWWISLVRGRILMQYKLY